MGDSTPRTNPSPLRHSHNAVSRKARSEQLKHDNFVVTVPFETFRTTFLDNARFNENTRESLSTLSIHVEEFIDSVEGLKSEVAGYGFVCTLFNAFIDSYHKTENIPEEDQITFVDHHSHPPCLHPQRYIDSYAKQKPDVLAVKKLLAKIWLKDVKAWRVAKTSNLNKPAISWSHIISLLEGKKDDGGDPLYQAAAYSGSLLQSRPDMPGNFTIAYSPSAFQLLWCDPCGVYTTPEISWNDKDHDICEILMAYIHFLHRPLLVDPTVEQQDPDYAFDGQSVTRWKMKSYSCAATWLITAQDTVYEVGQPISIGEPWTRMNMVWESTRYGSLGQPLSDRPSVIVKDSFPDSRRIQNQVTEDAVLDNIHLDGKHILGVAIKIGSFVVSHKSGVQVQNIDVGVLRNGSKIDPRTKLRIILDGSVQDCLITCKSVEEFFMTMYDVVEVLKHIHQRRGILHRDISAFNILRRTVRNIQAIKRDFSTDQPIFINALLAHESLMGDKDMFLRNHNFPSCLLIDFDNALINDAYTGIPRTGTAAFIAVAAGAQLCEGAYPHPTNVMAIPALEDEAKDAYTALFGSEHYEQQSLLHHNFATPVPDVDFECAPRHDAESCFWVIVWWLMRALPADAIPEEDRIDIMSAAFECIEQHRITGSSAIDFRTAIRGYNRRAWADVIHPGLHSLLPFLSDLSNLQRPNYALIPGLDDYNLHEATQRLLLREIFRFKKEGDPLNLHAMRREVKVPKTEGHATTKVTDLAKRRHDEESELQKKKESLKRRRDDKKDLESAKKKKKSNPTGMDPPSVPSSSALAPNSGRRSRGEPTRRAPVRAVNLKK